MKPLEAIRYGAESAVFFGVIGFFRLLGLERASAVGGFLGREILYRMPLSDRARANLHAAYPEMRRDSIEATIREMWDNLGRTVAEYAYLDRFTIRGARPRIALSGMENVAAAQASGRAIIFISGHFANWEILPLAAAQSGIEGGAVYRPVNNQIVDRWMVRQRMRNGPKEQITKGAQGTRRIFSLLRARKAIFLLGDQKTNEGLAVPFFGRDAMTTPVPAALALKLDAVLLPVRNERLNGSRFRVTVYPPIALEAQGDHSRDVLRLTAKINDVIEAMVRERPSQWLWIHRRWPKPDDKPRTRRGREAQALGGNGVRVEHDGSSAT